MILEFLISENERTARFEYTVKFICQTLGYGYNIVTEKNKLGKNALVITYAAPDKLQKLQRISGLNVFNSAYLNNLAELEKNVKLFEWQGVTIPVMGDDLTRENHAGWRKNRTDYSYRKTGFSIWSVEFDLFANIFYHLSRYEEKWRHFAEETASDYTTSILSRHHDLKIPVVDVLLDYFRVLTLKKSDRLVNIHPWPKGEIFGVAVTHDVDITRNVSLKRRLINSTYGMFKSILGEPEINRELQEEMDRQDELIWTYPKLQEMYLEQKIQGTFFFLARIFEGIHFRYNIGSKKFSSLIRSLVAEGHEVALHSSLHAFDQPQKYRVEKQRLEKITGSTITGLRQHYLRAKFPRLWRIAANNNFKYDTSLAYNYQAGYRAGTTHPFFTFDYNKDVALDLLEFSLVFFENNLPKDLDTPESLKNYVHKLLYQAERYQGLFVALLHPSNYAVEPYHTFWQNLLGEVKKKNTCILSLHEHWRWVKNRSKIKITPLSRSSIQLEKPAELKHFCIEVHDGAKLEAEKGINIEAIRAGCFKITASKNKFSLQIKK